MQAETDLHLWLPDGNEQNSLFPFFSARGCVQELRLLENAALQRTVNGKLLDTSSLSHRKYISIISGSDTVPPAFEGLWKGTALWVDCLQYLVCVLGAYQETVVLKRQAVPRSIIVQQAGGEDSRITTTEEQTVRFTAVPQGGFLYYRPRLLMRLLDWKVKTNEWEGGCTWELSLEEI